MRPFVERLMLALAAVLTLATAPAHALDVTRAITQFHHTAWTQREGMPGNIRAITQTADGFLWLGTEGGLYRFDGLRAERIERFGATRLPLGSVDALLATPDGDLWIGFQDDITTVSRVRRGALTTFEQKDGLPPGRTVQFAVDAAGGVWIRTEVFRGAEWLARYDGQAWRTIEGDFGTRATDLMRGVWDFAAAGDGTVWAKNGVALYYYRPGMARFEIAPNYSGRIMGFARARDGRLWTADQNAQRFYALPVLSQLTQVAPPALLAPVPETLRGIALIDRDGAMWCANQRQGGLTRIRSLAPAAAPISDRYTESDGLTSDRSFAIFEDREGNIWLGTDAGLDRFRPADLVLEPRIPLASQGPTMADTPDALYIYTGISRTLTNAADASASIFRIARDGEPRRVAANVGDLAYLAARGPNAFYATRPPNGGSNVHYTVREDGTVGRTAFPSNWAAPSEGVQVLPSPDGELWYPRVGVGYFRFRDGRETQMIAKATPAAPRLSGEWRGRPWVYYADGVLYEFDGDQVRERRANELRDVSTVATNADRMLFGGQLGVLDWDGQQSRTLPASRFPVLTAISRLGLSDNGDLWLATQAGVVRIAKADFERALADPSAPLPYRLFDFRDGLAGAPNADTIGSTFPRTPDGRLWFATASGLNWIDPSRIAHNAMAPPVVVTALRVGERLFDMPADLVLAPGSSNLQIDYTALSLAIPERNRFRYKLEGVDPDWVEAGDRRQAFYTRLEPGDYRFRVIAANNDGVWNEQGATLAFTIAPTFLQSIWFKFLVALFLAVLAWLAYTLRLRQEAARLQGRFEVRIAERERIARELHDTLLQGFHGLVLRFQAIANREPAESSLRASLGDALDRADAVLVEGRARVRDLRATTVEGDLAKAIVDCAHTIIEGDAPRFSLTVEGAPRALHTLVSEEIIRIAEEAIRNANQHAQAKAIEIILSYGRVELRLSIRDDGAGMPQEMATSGKAGHFGLIGLRERAERIGGRLDVASREEAGAEIVLFIPGRAAYRDRRVRRLDWLRPARPRSSP